MNQQQESQNYFRFTISNAAGRTHVPSYGVTFVKVWRAAAISLRGSVSLHSVGVTSTCRGDCVRYCNPSLALTEPLIAPPPPDLNHNHTGATSRDALHQTRPHSPWDTAFILGNLRSFVHCWVWLNNYNTRGLLYCWLVIDALPCSKNDKYVRVASAQSENNADLICDQ